MFINTMSNISKTLHVIFSLFHQVMAGGYDERLPENVEYSKELQQYAIDNGISQHVTFIRSFTFVPFDES